MLQKIATPAGALLQRGCMCLSDWRIPLGRTGDDDAKDDDVKKDSTNCQKT